MAYLKKNCFLSLLYSTGKCSCHNNHFLKTLISFLSGCFLSLSYSTRKCSCNNTCYPHTPATSKSFINNTVINHSENLNQELLLPRVIYPFLKDVGCGIQNMGIPSLSNVKFHTTNMTKMPIQSNNFFLHTNTICSTVEAEAISSNCCSNCPKKNSWIQILIDNSWEHENFVVISIGCNKGDDLVEVMEGLSGDSKFDKLNFRKTFNENAGQDLVGACPDHDDHLKTPWPEKRSVKGVCVEPMLSTLKNLQNTVNRLKLNNEIQIIHAAVSNKQGTTKFPNTDVGVESMGLESGIESATAFAEVNITTLDNILQSSPTNRIDLLSIDAEGYDYLVFEGAYQTLSSIYVRFIEFEYHVVPPWPKHNLHNLIRFLDIMMFDCYFQGNEGQLWRLTGCYHENYKVKAWWSNVVCVNRKEKKSASEFYIKAQTYGKWGV